MKSTTWLAALIAFALIAVVAVAAGCGSDDDDGSMMDRDHDGSMHDDAMGE